MIYAILFVVLYASIGTIFYKICCSIWIKDREFNMRDSEMAAIFAGFLWPLFLLFGLVEVFVKKVLFKIGDFVFLTFFADKEE